MGASQLQVKPERISQSKGVPGSTTIKRSAKELQYYYHGVSNTKKNPKPGVSLVTEYSGP